MTTVVATVRLASAGLHVIDRWVDALADALPDAQVGGSLTAGHIEIHLTAPGPSPARAILDAALRAAETPGVRVLSVELH